MSVDCHFWSAKGSSTKSEGSKCGHEASTFVRVKQTGRLCPLCTECLGVFQAAKAAVEKMPEKETGAAIKGDYELVSVADGQAEFAVQKPKAVLNP